jgi:hypothetical protein
LRVAGSSSKRGVDKGVTFSVDGMGIGPRRLF